MRVLQGRVVLISGGAAGLGRAAALRMAAEGARVALLDVDDEAGAKTAVEIRNLGGEAIYLRCDVRREEEVASAVEGAVLEFGGLHVLVTGAGILRGAFEPIEEFSLETFTAVLGVNVIGTFLCCKHAAPAIERSGGGVVLCISSGGGVSGPSSSLAYGSSKAAINGFCLTLERQLRPRGIRVNVVCPSALDTAMKRQNIRDLAATRNEDPEALLAATELADPDGLAKVLAFLASSDGDYVMGTVFTR